MADSKLDYFKKKIIAILKAKEEAEVKPEVKKSLEAMETVYNMFHSSSMGELEKAGYGVGTVRIWRGKKYKKVSANPTKWVRVYDKVDRGAKGSMTRLINKVDSCQSIDELLQFCMSNHAIFKDSNGVDLPILDELRKAVDEKKGRLENGDTSSIRPEKKTKKPVAKKPEVDIKNTPEFKKKFKEVYEYTKQIGVNNSKEQLKEQVKLFERDLKEDPSHEKDPNFMGQYQARLELLADKSNEKEPEKTVEDKEREERHAKMELENKVRDLLRDNTVVTEKDIQNALDKVHMRRYAPSANDFDMQSKNLERDIEVMKEALKKQLQGEDVGQTQKRLLEIIKEDYAEIEAIDIAEDEFKKGKWKEVYPGAYEFKGDDSLNLSQKFVDEIKDKKPKEEDKKRIYQNEATGVVNVDGHHITYGFTPKSSAEKFPMDLEITFDGKLLKKDSPEYELIRDHLGLQNYEADVNSKKYEPEETEAEKHENRSNAMLGNQNARKYGPEEIKNASKVVKAEDVKIGDEVPAQDPNDGTYHFVKVTDVKTDKNGINIETQEFGAGGLYVKGQELYIKNNSAPEDEETRIKGIKDEMKTLSDLFSKYASDWTDGVAYNFNRSAIEKDIDLKATYRAEGLKNVAKMRDECEKLGISIPEIPEDIQKKFDSYNEAMAKISGPYYMTYNERKEASKYLSSIPGQKLIDFADSCLRPIKEAYNKLSEQLPKVKEVFVEPVPGKTNEEHADLFILDDNPENHRKRLMYNGKPFETASDYSDWQAVKVMNIQQKVVKEAGMDPKAQVEYLMKDRSENKKDFVSNWSMDSALKKLGDAKLKEIAKPSMTDEEFRERLDNAIAEKQRTAYWIKQQIEKHLSNKAYEERAEQLLKERESVKQALDDVDLPVDPADMEEAKGLIGRKVNAIAGGSSYSKSLYRAELKKMIENRIRNQPALARAMLVYIKDYQKEHNVTIFTPSNEIWEQLPKLNENATNAIMNGETETQGGQSGELYSGDGVTSVVEDKDAGRYQVFFSGKPDQETRTLLKQNGFRWAPSVGAWQCYNTAHGENSLARVAKELGWKKNS